MIISHEVFFLLTVLGLLCFPVNFKIDFFYISFVKSMPGILIRIALNLKIAFDRMNIFIFAVLILIFPYQQRDVLFIYEYVHKISFISLK